MTFEEVRDRAIAELTALADVYLITQDEAERWCICINKSAFNGGGTK